MEITEDLPRMKIDFRRIEQVVLVLLNNAIEASEAGNIVQLKSFRRSSEVFIEVIDEGHGMSEEITSRLFTPYFTTKKSGMGLGLSLAQRIIHGHGGRIDVVSSCGNGTRMSVMLPISEADPTSRV